MDAMQPSCAGLATVKHLIVSPRSAISDVGLTIPYTEAWDGEWAVASSLQTSILMPNFRPWALTEQCELKIPKNDSVLQGTAPGLFSNSLDSWPQSQIVAVDYRRYAYVLQIVDCTQQKTTISLLYLLYNSAQQHQRCWPVHSNTIYMVKPVGSRA